MIINTKENKDYLLISKENLQKEYALNEKMLKNPSCVAELVQCLKNKKNSTTKKEFMLQIANIYLKHNFLQEAFILFYQANNRIGQLKTLPQIIDQLNKENSRFSIEQLEILNPLLLKYLELKNNIKRFYNTEELKELIYKSDEIILKVYIKLFSKNIESIEIFNTKIIKDAIFMLQKQLQKSWNTDQFSAYLIANICIIHMINEQDILPGDNIICNTINNTIRKIRLKFKNTSMIDSKDINKYLQETFLFDFLEYRIDKFCEKYRLSINEQKDEYIQISQEELIHIIILALSFTNSVYKLQINKYDKDGLFQQICRSAEKYFETSDIKYDFIYHRLANGKCNKKELISLIKSTKKDTQTHTLAMILYLQKFTKPSMKSMKKCQSILLKVQSKEWPEVKEQGIKLIMHILSKQKDLLKETKSFIIKYIIHSNEIFVIRHFISQIYSIYGAKTGNQICKLINKEFKKAMKESNPPLHISHMFAEFTAINKKITYMYENIVIKKGNI